MYNYYPLGKYQYNCLPMGIARAPDVFQEKMSELVADLELRMYLSNLSNITKGTFDDHLYKIKQVLKRLQAIGLCCNMKLSVLGR